MGDIVKREELRGKYKGLGIKISGLSHTRYGSTTLEVARLKKSSKKDWKLEK